VVARAWDSVSGRVGSQGGPPLRPWSDVVVNQPPHEQLVAHPLRARALTRWTSIGSAGGLGGPDGARDPRFDLASGRADGTCVPEPACLGGPLLRPIHGVRATSRSGSLLRWHGRSTMHWRLRAQRIGRGESRRPGHWWNGSAIDGWTPLCCDSSAIETTSHPYWQWPKGCSTGRHQQRSEFSPSGGARSTTNQRTGWRMRCEQQSVRGAYEKVHWNRCWMTATRPSGGALRRCWTGFARRG
jgi:hypothetical protein